MIIRFGSKWYGRIVDIPVSAYCSPLVADLFLFCFERDVLLSLSDNNQPFNTTEPRHEISNNVVCATNKASDQPAQSCSLIRAFASCLNIL